ncbi:MAG: Ig domain-containing protein, partial [Caldimonas sp.]
MLARNSLIRTVLRVASALLGLALTGTLAQAAPTVVDANPPHVIRGIAYSAVIATGAGGVGPYTFVANSGLPLALTLASNGTMSGTTCGTNGNYTVSVTVTDSTAATGTGNVQVIVNAAGSNCTLTVTNASLPAGATGTPYSQTLATSGGTAPYTYSVVSGSLPAGLSLSTGGTISGTPTVAGSTTFSIGVADSVGAVGVRTYTLVIAAGLALGSTPSSARQVGVAYSQSNVASGGTSPYTYAISAGALPAGTALNAGTGLVSGTPTTAGAFSYTVRVTDAAAATAFQTLSGTIAAALTLASTPAAVRQVGVAYSQANSASGGTAPYAYSISAGALPAGLTLNAGTGAVSGTPTTAGLFSYTVRVTDGVAAAATQTVSGTISSAVALASSPSAAAQVGVAYSQSNIASGGTAP